MVPFLKKGSESRHFEFPALYSKTTYWNFLLRGKIWHLFFWQWDKVKIPSETKLPLARLYLCSVKSLCQFWECKKGCFLEAEQTWLLLLFQPIRNLQAPPKQKQSSSIGNTIANFASSLIGNRAKSSKDSKSSKDNSKDSGSGERKILSILKWMSCSPHFFPKIEKWRLFWWRKIRRNKDERSVLFFFFLKNVMSNSIAYFSTYWNSYKMDCEIHFRSLCTMYIALQ